MLCVVLCCVVLCCVVLCCVALCCVLSCRVVVVSCLVSYLVCCACGCLVGCLALLVGGGSGMGGWGVCPRFCVCARPNMTDSIWPFYFINIYIFFLVFFVTQRTSSGILRGRAMS